MSLEGVWLLGFASTEGQANDDLEKKKQAFAVVILYRVKFTQVFL